MSIYVKAGDLFTSHEEAVALTIDHSNWNTLGTMANLLATRHEEFWEECVKPAKPQRMNWGMVYGVDVPQRFRAEIPWQLVVVADTLHHEGVLEHSEKRSIVARGISGALYLAGQRGLTSIATTLWMGGKRLKDVDAANAMALGYEQRPKIARDVSLQLYINDPNVSEIASGVFRSLGYR